ncbi:MAG: xylulose 5-phosphate 3-epimerase [Pseudomonadota bacterium]
MDQQENWHRHPQATRARHCREHDPAFAAWAVGYGVIRHESDTQVRVFELIGELEQRSLIANRQDAFDLLMAADRTASAAMWLVVHMTYARHVKLDGSALAATDCKLDPQGHTGGSLNMVPAYIGYLALNALTRFTRAWVMGQGHCVAAIDACNLLIGNTTPEHAARYDVSDGGLTRFVQDFYAYAVNGEGRPVSPLGSHVNVHTAGGITEGGYLGFTELQYVHMPLPGERLVAFLSDGAWEEQRGSDWAARWWRAEDCGFVMPVMIANGRRIEQRTSVAQHGGTAWLGQHLRLNGFHPVIFDGHDPAAYVCALWEAEERQAAFLEARRNGQGEYPFPLRYLIAECVKGYGFPGAGSNRAHNLPLSGNPSRNSAALAEFNRGTAALHVPFDDLTAATRLFAQQAQQARPPERDHALMRRHVPALTSVAPQWLAPGSSASAMAAIDTQFFRTAEANPAHRVRLGNPDELASNRMVRTLNHLRHRALDPEPGVAEALQGSIITALNEEAVACAALGNKGGLNLVVSYEAFAMKMLGAMRQELLFARHQKEAGQPPQWLSLPFLLTSHTWENGKNEQSHQDPALCETLLGEMSDTAIVRFPVDANSATACLADCLQRRGELHVLLVAKAELPVLLTAEQAQALVHNGALLFAGNAAAPLQLIAVGAYQLIECHKAWQRLQAKGVSAALVAMLEPARFRQPRDSIEATILAPASLRQQLSGNSTTQRVLVTHTRPEPLLGLLRPLDGSATMRALGYLNHGGTLNVAGMLYANRCSWLHILAAVAELQGERPSHYLESDELAVLEGEGNPLPLIQSGPLAKER